MPAGLTTLSQEITYNGYTFPVSRRTEFTGRAKKDDARRTIIGVEYSLRVEFYVLNTSEVNSSAEFDEIRDRLSKAGGKLTLSGLGLGNNISVNDASGQWDMAWGPFPEVLNWKTIGANTSFFCVWVCNFFIPECSTIVSGLPKNLIAFNFRSNVSIDQNRLEKISTDGYLEIALTRTAQGNRSIPDRAGRYRPTINVPLLPNFTRVSEDFKETMDRRRLDFVIIDQGRAPNELPWGCSAATSSHSAASGAANAGGDMNSTSGSVPRAFASGNVPLNYFGRISASYTMLPGFSKSIAAVHFADYMNSIISGARERGTNNTIYKQEQNGVLIKKFSVNEGGYQKNREISFDVEYMFFTSLNDILTRGGFCKVEPNTNGDLWRIKWNQKYTRNYGIANIDFLPSNDAIIDVCARTPQIIITPNGKTDEYSLGSRPKSIDNTLKARNQTDATWIAYECFMCVESDSGNFQVAELVKKEDENGISELGGGGIGARGAASGGRLVNTSTRNSGSIIGERRPPLYKVILWGGAIRAGSPIFAPNLISVGGLPAKPGIQLISQSIADTWADGTSVFECYWQLEYFIDSSIDWSTVSFPQIDPSQRDGEGLKI